MKMDLKKSSAKRLNVRNFQNIMQQDRQYDIVIIQGVSLQ